MRGKPSYPQLTKRVHGLGETHHGGRRSRIPAVIDAALAYGDAWRARKAFGKQFRQEPRVDQVFLKATAAPLDRNLTDSGGISKGAIRLENDLSEQMKIKQENQI